MPDECTGTCLAVADGERECAKHRCLRALPRRNPGSHWTGPSGEHVPVEVPATPRTVVNVGRLGRAIV
jgi:hypothetical protein